MILFFLYFFAYLLVYLFISFLLGNNVVGCVVTFRSWCALFVVLLCELGTIPPPQGGFVGRAVAGKAYRRPRPTLTPQVCMYFTLELHVLY